MIYQGYNFSWPQDDIPATSRIVSCPPGAQAPLLSSYNPQASFSQSSQSPQSPQSQFSHNFSNDPYSLNSAYAYMNPPPSFSSNARPPAQPPPPPINFRHSCVYPEPNAYRHPTAGIYMVPSTPYYAPPPYPPPSHRASQAIHQSSYPYPALSDSSASYSYTIEGTPTAPAQFIAAVNAYTQHARSPPPLPPNKPTPHINPITSTGIPMTYHIPVAMTPASPPRSPPSAHIHGTRTLEEITSEGESWLQNDMGWDGTRSMGDGEKVQGEDSDILTPHISWASYIRSQGVSPTSPVVRQLVHASTSNSDTTTTSTPILPTHFDTLVPHESHCSMTLSLADREAAHRYSPSPTPSRPASPPSISHTTRHAELETDVGTEYGASVDDIRNALALEMLLGGVMGDTSVEVAQSDLDPVVEEDVDEAYNSEVQDDDECDLEYDDQGVDDGAYFLRCALAAASRGDDTYLVDFLVLGIPVPFSFRRHIFTVNNTMDYRGRILPRAELTLTNKFFPESCSIPCISTRAETLILADDIDHFRILTVPSSKLPPPIDFNCNPLTGELRQFLAILLGDGRSTLR